MVLFFQKLKVSGSAPEDWELAIASSMAEMQYQNDARAFAQLLMSVVVRISLAATSPSETLQPMINGNIA